MTEQELRLKSTIRSLKMSLKADPDNKGLQAKLEMAENELVNLGNVDEKATPTQEKATPKQEKAAPTQEKAAPTQEKAAPTQEKATPKQEKAAQDSEEQKKTE